MPGRVQIDAERISTPFEGRGSSLKNLPLCLVKVLHAHVEMHLLWNLLPWPLWRPVVLHPLERQRRSILSVTDRYPARVILNSDHSQ